MQGCECSHGAGCEEGGCGDNILTHDSRGRLLNVQIHHTLRTIHHAPYNIQVVYTVLACARIGAVHSVVFAGFSADSLRDRILDCNSKHVLTANIGEYVLGMVCTYTYICIHSQMCSHTQIHIHTLIHTHTHIPYTTQPSNIQVVAVGDRSSCRPSAPRPYPTAPM
ncbi:hypothetical protein EON63_03520 [archaeon]|nr:MAG: hypothetical protein EON63_03520 [archaeon]